MIFDDALDGHYPTAVAINAGRRQAALWRAACTCGCIRAEEVLPHHERTHALDEARMILQERVHGPVDPPVWSSP